MNNVFAGTIPFEDKDIPPGEYTITVRKEGYDAESKTIYLEAAEETIEFNLTESEGKFFRFAGFGNDRLTKILNGVELYINYYSPNISSDLINSITGITSNFHPTNIGIGLCYDAIPLSFNIDYSLPWKPKFPTADFDNDSLYFNNLRITIAWIPFVFGEILFPSVGYTFIDSKAEYKIGYDSKKKWSNSYYMPYFGLDIIIAQKVVIKVFYQKSDNKDMNSFVGFVAGYRF